MKIHGREIKFKKTVKGTNDLAKICPNGDLRRIDEVFSSEDTSTMQEAMAVFVVAMNEGYEYSMKYEKDGYEPHPLTKEEVLFLDYDEFFPLFQQAVDVFKADKQTIKAEGKKTTKTK